jgi:hypothetical protein
MSGAAIDVDKVLAANPGSYLRQFTFEGEEHRIVVQPIPGGKGYAPLDVLASGDVALAARIATAACNARL